MTPQLLLVTGTTKASGSTTVDWAAVTHFASNRLIGPMPPTQWKHTHTDTDNFDWLRSSSHHEWVREHAVCVRCCEERAITVTPMHHPRPFLTPQPCIINWWLIEKSIKKQTQNRFQLELYKLDTENANCTLMWSRKNSFKLMLFFNILLLFLKKIKNLYYV